MSSGTASREFGKVAVLMGRGRRGTAERPVREDEAARQLAGVRNLTEGA